MRNRRVLLMEDDDVRALLHAVVTNAGYAVTAAGCFTDGCAALNASPGATFDLVIADVMLPDGRGTDLAQTAEERGTKSLVLTGNPDRMMLFEQQGIDYLCKPFRPGEFLRRVEARLASETE